MITDRRVLDRQLQDAVYQIKHAQGVVQAIDRDSRQFAEALLDGTKIVVTTLQKFPFVMRDRTHPSEVRASGGHDTAEVPIRDAGAAVGSGGTPRRRRAHSPGRVSGRRRSASPTLRVRRIGSGWRDGSARIAAAALRGDRR